MSKSINFEGKKEVLLLLGLLTLTVIYPITVRSVYADVDLAKGRVYIDKIQWTDNPGSYAFEIYMNIMYARNCLDSPWGDEGGRAYTEDYYYTYGLGESNILDTLKLTGDTGTHYDNYYSPTSYFRRGSSSSEDGIYLKFRIRKWGTWFGLWVDEGYSAHTDWHWIDANSDTSYETSWVSGVKIWYKLDITGT